MKRESHNGTNGPCCRQKTKSMSLNCQVTRHFKEFTRTHSALAKNTGPERTGLR